MIYAKFTNSICGDPRIYNYTLGINSYIGKNKNDGMYFTDIHHIFNYINYGSTLILAEEILGEKPIYDPETMILGGSSIPGYRFKKINVLSINVLDKESLLYLLNNGANIADDNYGIVTWSYRYDKDIYITLLNLYPEIVYKVINNYLGLEVKL